MCDSCFYNEIPRFVEQAQFEEFDLALSKKTKPLSTTEIKYLGKIEYPNDKGYGRYLCLDSNTEWWYSEPDQAWRGFFVIKENGEHLLAQFKKEDKRKSIGCIIALIAFIGIVSFLFLW